MGLLPAVCPYGPLLVSQPTPFGRRLYPVRQTAQHCRHGGADWLAMRARPADGGISQCLLLAAAHALPGDQLVHAQESVLVIQHDQSRYQLISKCQVTGEKYKTARPLRVTVTLRSPRGRAGSTSRWPAVRSASSRPAK